MKSLKRTLCLVLALVMVLGLFGIASATEFTDDNQVQYKEAVEVMTGIGAISGMGDGTFNPKGTITRAQAAKLVTYAVIGKTAADGLAGVSSSFTDVTVEGGFAWAIPSIEYLVKAGVINGRGDGTFDPNGEISSVATLKMLLCALGYGKKGEYTGDGWDFQTTLDANKYGLTAGRTSTASVSAPATREEVALYCFNTIQKPMVEYVSTLDVYLNRDGGLTGGGTTETIWSTVYPKLKVNGATTPDYSEEDAFGAPANEWTYNGKEISKAAIPAAVTFTSAQTDATLKAALKGYKHDTSTASVTIVTNGEQAGSPVTTDNGGLTNMITAIKAACGNGTVVKVYANTSNYITNVVVIKTDLAKVASVNTVTKTVTLTTVSAAPVVSAGYTITAEAQPELYAKVAGLAEGDLVLVTPVDTNPAQGSTSYAAASISIPTQMTGKLSSITNGTSVVTIDGKGYGVAAGTAVAPADVKLDAGTDAAVWLDDYGFIVNIKAAESTYDVIPSFAFVVEAYQSMPANKIINMAKIVLPDGSVKDVPTAVSGNAATQATAGTLYKVAGIDKDTGAYALATTTPKDASALSSGNAQTLNATDAIELVADKEIKSSDRRLNIDVAGDGSDHYYNNFYSGSVKFIYITKDSKGTFTVSDVKDEVQAVKTNDTEKTYAIIEPNDPKDVTSTPVVSAVILVNGAPQTAADTSKVLYIPKNITASNDPTPGFGYVAKVSTDSMYNKTTKRYEDVNVYRVFENGVEKTMPITTASVTNGFWNYKASANIEGAYEITEAFGTGANTVTNKAVGDTIEANNPNNVGNSVYLTTATKDMNIAGATIVDARTDAQKAIQTQMPVTESLSGVLTALKKYNLTVSVLYDVKTQAASIVYVDQATAAATLNIAALTAPDSTAKNSNTVSAEGLAATIMKYGNFKIKVDVTVPGTQSKDQVLKLTVTGGGAGKNITYTITENGTMGAPVAYNSTNGITIAKGKTVTVEFTVSNVTEAVTATAIAFTNSAA